MATTAPYPEPPFQEIDGKPTNTPLRSSKRKRDNLDTSIQARGAQNARRSSSHQFAQQPVPQQDHSADAVAQATDGMEANAFINAHQAGQGAADDPTQQSFDLSALQAHQQATSPQGNVGPGPNGPGTANMDTAAAALNHYSMTVPPHPAQEFMSQPTAPTSYTDPPIGEVQAPGDFQGLDGTGAQPQDPNAPPDQQLPGAASPDGGPGKPAVGSDEWHKVRKDNHKEVERRRRETINEGINELAKIVPGCEKNKGSILARAVQYIQKLQDDASQNIDKWTFEKLVTEQAIAEISGKLTRAWQEKEAWKRVAREAGVDVEAVDLRLDEEDDGAAQAQAHQQDLQGQLAEQQAKMMESNADNAGGEHSDAGDMQPKEDGVQDEAHQ